MAADSITVSMGVLDISKVYGTLDFDVSKYTAGGVEVVPVGAAPNYGSWSCSLKEADGPGTAQAFASPLAFSSSVLIQKTPDLTGTQRLVITTDTAGSSGLVEFWGTFKAGQPLT